MFPYAEESAMSSQEVFTQKVTPLTAVNQVRPPILGVYGNPTCQQFDETHLKCP